MTPEGRIKKNVKVMLDLFGRDQWRFMPVQTGFGSVAHDFILCFRGHFISFETKRAGKDLTPLQKGTRSAMWDAGGIVLRISNPDELKAAQQILDKLEWVHGRRDQIPGYIAEEAQGESEQHVGSEQQAEAADQATGGHHGAPRKKPRRRAKSAAGRDDQRLTAVVTDGLCATHRPFKYDPDGWK